MNNELQGYYNTVLRVTVRATVQNGEVWFIGKDVTDILGYTNASKALTDHVDDEDKGVTKCYTLGGEQKLTTINESGLYSLILSSKMPNAKQFKHWVTNEVLPSIRKNGGYIANQEHMTPAQIVANALIVAQKIIEEQKPKIEFYNTALNADGTYSMQEASEILKLGYGNITLFKKLRDMHILNDLNTPYQDQVNAGRFKVFCKTITKGNKPENISVTRVTAKGLEFISKLLKTEAIK